VAVVTGPDKPAGRGQKLHESAVKKFAVSQNIPVLQPVKLRAPEFLAELKSYNADLQVVVAFRMLPELVWNMPEKGTINVHASLLPNYRGAAPINHAIINGEKKSGVTTFLLQHEIDTGNILFSTEVEILDNDNAGDLHDKLMLAGAELLIRTVNAIKKNDIHPIPQDSIDTESLKHAPKIFKEDCLINWENDSVKIYNLIRGLSPYPTAFTHIDGKVLKIYESEIIIEKHDLKPGTYISNGKNELKFATKDGFLKLLEIQIEGKKRMSVSDFLRGYRLEGTTN
jgi:methionyl-tRNA formyltransferase